MRVLVVEDELRMAALLKRGLEEDGYAVDVAATGPDDLWQAGEFGFDAEGVTANARRGPMEAGLRLASATRRACVLPSKEFALLELFLRHPGILEHVWDVAYEGASNVVDQYVLYLRRGAEVRLCWRGR